MQDRGNNLILWNQTSDSLEQKGKFKLSSQNHFKWLNLSLTANHFYCVCVSLAHDSADLYLLALTKSSQETTKNVEGNIITLSGDFNFITLLHRSIGLLFKGIGDNF